MYAILAVDSRNVYGDDNYFINFEKRHDAAAGGYRHFYIATRSHGPREVLVGGRWSKVVIKNV